RFIEVRDVCRYKIDPTSGLFGYESASALELFMVASDEQNDRAAPRKIPGDVEPKTAGAAGHDAHRSLQIHSPLRSPLAQRHPRAPGEHTQRHPALVDRHASSLLHGMCPPDPERARGFPLRRCAANRCE